jgi:hypothetical protein
MAGLMKIADSEIYIGIRVPYKSVVQLSDFAGHTWTRIDGLVTLGDLGSERPMQTQEVISGSTTLYGRGVRNFPMMSNVFVPMVEDPGQIAFRAAEDGCGQLSFKVQMSGECGVSSVVTISQATPGVVTWTAHGLANGTAVTFSTTGVLPAPLVPDTIYFVVGAAANTFQVSATVGGAAINTTVAGSGVHTAQAISAGTTRLFYGLVGDLMASGGSASDNQLITLPIQPICKAIWV